jgi:Reverse transcriptase (RNA-dependent DNA polymerase)
MPFGLTNAPITFQALMNDVFRVYVDKFILVYLDDVLIFSRSAEERKEHVELTLKRCGARSCLRNCQSVSSIRRREWSRDVLWVRGGCVRTLLLGS